jgi:hypothetical protein
MYTGLVFTYFLITEIQNLLRLNSRNFLFNIRWKKSFNPEQYSLKEKLTKIGCIIILEIEFMEGVEKLQKSRSGDSNKT